MENTLTILGESKAEYIEKRSKFIAVCRHCETQEEAIAFIEQQKKQYWDARHNVYAYIVGSSSKFSDDGEPHNTAGKPVLDVLKGFGITDVAVVVTRYFGGILLGTGGLVRAYSKAAKDALNIARKAEKALCKRFSANCPYSCHSSLIRLFDEQGAVVEKSDFGQEVVVFLHIKSEFAKKMVQSVKEAFSGEILLKELEEKNFLILKEDF